MKKHFLLSIIILNLSSALAQDKPKTYDARGLSIRQRLELVKQIKEESRKANQQSPDQKAETFFQELKTKGTIALADVKKGSMIEDETTAFVDQEMQKTEDRSSGFKKISGAMSEEGGEIKSYKKIGNDETLLNGMYYRTRYLIEYKNGKTQNVEMLYIKPTISGDFVLTEFNVN